MNCLIYIELVCFRHMKSMFRHWILVTLHWLCLTTEPVRMNNTELFKLKLSQAEHVSVLKSALKLSTFSDPDICLVSREGFKVYTHR